MEGVMETSIHNLIEKSVQNGGILEYEDIMDYAKTLQRYQLHVHLVVQGANGFGKSHAMLSLMKLYNPKPLQEHKILFAYNSNQDLMDAIAYSENDIIGIDELKNFLDYLDFQNIENKELIKYIEYARRKRNMMIGCASDIRNINKNYREKQVQIIIWIFDRFKKAVNDNMAYAGVYVANPMISTNDKFNFSVFNGVSNLKYIKYLSERSCKSFIGYMFIKDSRLFLTDEELQWYEENQLKGIEASKEKSKEKMQEKDLKRKGIQLANLDVPEFILKDALFGNRL